MEVRRTVRVKLGVPDGSWADLHATIRQFNDAANFTGEHGRNDDGYSAAGDSNAAKNIDFKLLTVPGGKRPSGLGDGQLALKSGTVNGNGGYTPPTLSRPTGSPRASPRLQSWVADNTIPETSSSKNWTHSVDFYEYS